MIPYFMVSLVTGGLGFIGSHIVDKLLQLGHSVIVVDDESSGSEIADLPEDIWSIHRAGLKQEQGGVIRFAEDIEDLRGGVTARRGKRAPTTQTGRNKRSANSKGNKKGKFR